MKVDSFPADQEWGLLLARDYPGVEQTAIVLSDDWRHGTANRVRGVGFYNLYRDAKGYVKLSFRPGAPPQAIQVADTADSAAVEEPGTTAYFSGHHLTTLTRLNIFQGEQSLSAYNPITNRVSARVRFGELRRGVDVDHVTLTVRKMGGHEPLASKTQTAPCAGKLALAMDANPIGPRAGSVLTWVAPDSGAVDVDYQVGNFSPPTELPPNPSITDLNIHALSLDGGAATLLLARKDKAQVLVGRTLFKDFGQWVPIRAAKVAVAKGDRVQLYITGATSSNCHRDLMTGKLGFTGADGVRRGFYPVGEFAKWQGGSTGVWRYQADQDAEPNPDGEYQDMGYGAAFITPDGWRVLAPAPGKSDSERRPAVFIYKVTVGDWAPAGAGARGLRGEGGGVRPGRRPGGRQPRAVRPPRPRQRPALAGRQGWGFGHSPARLDTHQDDGERRRADARRGRQGI